MALSKAVGYVVVVLVMYYALENQGYIKSLNVFFEEWMDTKPSHALVVEKREMTTPSPTPSSPSPTPSSPSNGTVEIDFVLDLRVPVALVPSNFIDQFRDILRNFSTPHPVTERVTLMSLDFTTGCYPISTGGLQCQCEEQFAWPSDMCEIYGTCTNTTAQTCSCINSLPSDGQFCEPLTMNTTTTTTTMTPTTTTATTPMTTTTPAMTTTTTMTTPTTTMTSTTTATPVMTTMTPAMTTTTTTTTTPKTTTTAKTTTVTTPATTMTATTMTATTMTTTTSTITTPTATEVRNLSLTLDIDYDPAFNNPTHQLYKDIKNTIQTQGTTFISNLKSAELIKFRSGSTIADYSVRATVINVKEIEALKTGIFSDLSGKYPMILDSTEPLTFAPAEVFLAETVTVTCGPPPLNLSTDWTSEWRRDGNLIFQDNEHSFLNNNGVATLTISKFFASDNGLYECRLKQDKSVFRQKSTRTFTAKERPLIQVTPIRRKVECEVGKQVTLQCSVQSPYTVKFKERPDGGSGRTITFLFSVDDCVNKINTFTCQVETDTKFEKSITLELSTEDFDCRNSLEFGDGKDGDVAEAPCDQNRVGMKTAVCNKTVGDWTDIQDNCTLREVEELLGQSQFLNSNSLPLFVERLSNVTRNFTTEVLSSPNDVNAIVQILNNVATASSNITITKGSMENVLITAGILTTDQAKGTWNTLNTNNFRNNFSSNTERASSTFLFSLESITKALTEDSFDIVTPSILLNKTTFTDSFSADFYSTVAVNISDRGSNNITVITFASMDNVLPARDENKSSFNVINGQVVLVQSINAINNITLRFDTINDTLQKPQCVFWNFSLLDGLGGWDNEGCELLSSNGTVTCHCKHLTSFSILMSPYSPANSVVSSTITYIGVGISMASLVICLIIEAVIWRKIRRNNTSYLRHVSIVNIAVSLLIANIWFIIGAHISDTEKKACTAATFFIHVFYLSLFFWMLASGLLLLYRTISVFDHGLSKNSMLAIGFSLGYGAPLIIAIITIAVTTPKDEYIQKTGACWLNFDESKALLAFVIPALLIVLINFVILFVVIYKMLRRRAVAAQADEKHVLVVIIRSLAVLTPFFGITWGLGVGTMTHPENEGIHISFSFFNSLQGFFILVFGTLLDKKVRSEIAIKSQRSSGTNTTSGGNTSTVLGFFRNRIRGRDGYNVSSNASGHSFTNT